MANKTQMINDAKDDAESYWKWVKKYPWRVVVTVLLAPIAWGVFKSIVWILSKIA